MNREKILVVDDEIGGREAFNMILKDDYEVLTADNGKDALKLVEDGNIHLVILDIIMPEIDGIEVLKRIKEMDDRLNVIMITATKSIKTAVDAMKLGAFDYITKPFDVNEVRLLVQKALERRALINELTYLRSELKKKYGFDNIIGNSKQMRAVYEEVRRVAESKSTVLITGESGTGKELIARAIHFNSTRKNKPFIAVQCAALPESLLESELFGHEKGAFTDATTMKLGRFELADSGTLFLDEIGEMSPRIQAKILRALEEHEFVRVGGTKTIKIDVRFITASNMDLMKAVQEGIFREDLYYRINVVPIFLPPLRERIEDIPLLANHFLEKYRLELNPKVSGISPEAMDLLGQYHWPGNVRELENVIERILTFSNSETVLPEDLPDTIKSVKVVKKNQQIREIPSEPTSLEGATKEFEKELIIDALKKSNWIISDAAKRLNTTRRILKYKMDELGIKKEGKTTDNEEDIV